MEGIVREIQIVEFVTFRGHKADAPMLAVIPSYEWLDPFICMT